MDVKFVFFDCNFNHLPGHNGDEWTTDKLEESDNFEEILEICRILSSHFLYVKVDLHNENRNIYFGELTFFHVRDIIPFEPRSLDCEFGII